MRLSKITAIAAVALLAMTAVAVADVFIYKNDFATKGKQRQISKVSGGAKCARFGVSKEFFGVLIKRGPAHCVYRTPVTGDRRQPDHAVQIDGKIRRSTPAALRDSAYVSVSLRAGTSDRHGYVLRVFPKGDRWRLIRRPDNAAFPLSGTNPAIRGIGNHNRLKIKARGETITARVNGTTLTSVSDPAAEDVEGKDTRFGVGHGRQSSKDLRASFDNLRISIPSP